MSIKITNNVTYVGQIDGSTRHFHGEQLTTNHGTIYNSYLIQCEKSEQQKKEEEATKKAVEDASNDND